MDNSSVETNKLVQMDKANTLAVNTSINKMDHLRTSKTVHQISEVQINTNLEIINNPKIKKAVLINLADQANTNLKTINKVTKANPINKAAQANPISKADQSNPKIALGREANNMDHLLTASSKQDNLNLGKQTIKYHHNITITSTYVL